MAERKPPSELSDLRELTDPRAMRALAHPTRLALLEALADAGTLTATQAGEAIAESPASCSFHLRQLAKYGFVEEAGGGTGRQRPWKLAHVGMRFPDVQEDPDAAMAAVGLQAALRERHLARYARATAARGHQPKRWREVTGDSQSLFYVTPDEMRELDEELGKVLLRYHDRIADPAKRPKGSEPVEVLVLSYLRGE
jgi:DNA-binding transcriptional ArsR family regulator